VKPDHLGGREIMLDRVLDIREMAGDSSHLGPLNRTLFSDILLRGLPRKHIAGKDDGRNNLFELTRSHANFPRSINFSLPNPTKRKFIVDVPESILCRPFDAKKSFWFYYLVADSTSTVVRTESKISKKFFKKFLDCR
jgi:hypothetical protein